MASVPTKGICSYCQSESTQLRNGWRYRSGEFARLCEPCGSAYENGTFCSKFHLECDGWRDCLVCGKMIHCGCIMSFHLYESLDFGGIGCTGCSVESTVLVSNQYSFFTNATSEVSCDSSDPVEAEHTVDSGKMLFGVMLPSDSSIPPDVQSPAAQFGEQNESSLNGAKTVTDPSVGKQTSLEPVLIGPPSQPPSPAAHIGDQDRKSLNRAGTSVDPGSSSQKQSPAVLLGEPNKSSLNEAQLPVGPFVGNETVQGDTSAKITSAPHSLPEITDKELPGTSGDSNTDLVLLFEKLLSASDADPKLARLVLPKLCAESFFPSAPEGHRYPIEVRDISGKEWKFYFRVWRNGPGRMYVLDGVREYMAAMEWKAGDKVTFYKTGSKGKYVIETKKVSANSGTKCALNPSSSQGREDAFCLRCR